MASPSSYDRIRAASLQITGVLTRFKNNIQSTQIVSNIKNSAVSAEAQVLKLTDQIDLEALHLKEKLSATEEELRKLKTDNSRLRKANGRISREKWQLAYRLSQQIPQTDDDDDDVLVSASQDAVVSSQESASTSQITDAVATSSQESISSLDTTGTTNIVFESPPK